MIKYPRQTIENCFKATHPVIGNHSRCATGEVYVTYAIATKSAEASMEMLINTFRVLALCCAVIKPQGAPVTIAEIRPKYLYWRHLPALDKDEMCPEYYTAYCRAVVSEIWEEEGQEI